MEQAYGISAAAQSLWPLLQLPVALRLPAKKDCIRCRAHRRRRSEDCRYQVVREITQLGLGESKALVEGAPQMVKKGSC